MEYIYTQKKIVGDVVFSIQNKNILRITNAITYDDSGYDTFFSHKDMRLNNNKKDKVKPKLIKIWIDENKAKKLNISIDKIENIIYEILNELKVTEYC